MGIQELTLIVQSAAASVALILVLWTLWPTHRLDRFRQDVFVVRDELFDFAASGRIGFNHPSYRLLRASMNGFIRYGHQLTFFRLICTSLHWRVLDREPDFSWASQWEISLKQLDEETAHQLRLFHARTLTLVIKRLVAGSPVLLAAAVAVVTFELLRMRWTTIRQVAAKAATAIVNFIVDPRLLEEEAARA